MKNENNENKKDDYVIIEGPIELIPRKENKEVK